jgi:hypothetical protein
VAVTCTFMSSCGSLVHFCRWVAFHVGVIFSNVRCSKHTLLKAFYSISNHHASHYSITMASLC